MELGGGMIFEWVFREGLTQNKVTFELDLKEMRKLCTEITGRKRAQGTVWPARGPGFGAHRGQGLPLVSGVLV